MVSKWVITPIHPIYKEVITHLLTSWDILVFCVRGPMINKATPIGLGKLVAFVAICKGAMINQD